MVLSLLSLKSSPLQEFTFEVFKSTNTLDTNRWAIVAVASAALAAVVCLLTAITGLFAFGDELESDVMVNFSDYNTVCFYLFMQED